MPYENLTDVILSSLHQVVGYEFLEPTMTRRELSLTKSTSDGYEDHKFEPKELLILKIIKILITKHLRSNCLECKT